MQTSGLVSSNSGAEDRLSSWKEIATYLKCGVRTVQRWESLEGLPVYRHQHQKNGTVYAFKPELDAWRKARASSLDVTAARTLSGSSQASEELPSDPEESLNPRAAGPGNPFKNTVGGGFEAREPGAQKLDPPRTKDRVPGSGDHETPVSAGAVLLTSKATTDRHGGLSRGVGYGYALAIVGLAAATVYFVRQRPRAEPRPQATREMLAVLPFANLSGDASEDYFSDGLTEEMITELGRLDPDHLGVIARTSAMKYKHTQEDIAQIGRELGVSYVLEGSVRRAQNRVRVSAQLIQVSDQTHLWAQNFEGDMRNTLRVQEQVADAITQRIQLNLERGPQSAARGSQTADLDAYDNYLKGRYFFNLRSSESLHKGITYFTAAIQRDANYARAYAGLADCYTLLALYGEPIQQVMPRAKAAALKSVALNDASPEAHTSLGAIEALWDWNWPAAERDFKRAISLDPNYSPAHHWYANLYLIPQGRLTEAVDEMKVAATLDPVSLIVITDLGWSYFVSGQYDKAFAEYSKAIEMSPDFVPVHFRLAQYYVQLHVYDKAIAQSEQSVRLDGFPDTSLTNGQPTPVTEEDYRRYVRQRLADLDRNRTVWGSGHQPLPIRREGYAVFYTELGQTDQAIQNLQGAIEERDPALIYLAVDPAFLRLRTDSRFHAIERRIGLPTS